jgi:hypothetical protein
MIEVTAGRGRRLNWLQDDDLEMGEYWTLKEEALDRHLWGTGLGGRGNCRKANCRLNECHSLAGAHKLIGCIRTSAYEILLDEF